MAQISYGTITITDVTDGANANIWTTSVAPTTPDYTFTISNLTGSTTDTPRVGDIILQGVYRYTITNINGTTVLAGSRQSLQGATGAAGGRWYSGTGITGTSTTATIFSGSGVANAVVGDMYLNTSTNNVYQCTVPGNASTAKWVYVSNIKGGIGPQGRSTTRVETEYYRKLSGGSAPTSTTTGSTTIPDYIDGCTYYTRTITYFDSGDPNKSEWILNNTLTNEIKNAYDAWIKAGVAESKTAKVYEDNTGLVVASGINGAAITGGTESTYGYNTKLAPTFLGLRYNNINLARLTTTETNPALEFYIPTVNGSGVPSQGAKGLSIGATALTFYNPSNSSKVIELGTKNSVSTLSFYNPSNSNISMMDLTSSGLIFKTSAGAEIGKFGSDTSGGLLELSGRLNIKGGGRIGQDSDNYWEFGDNKSYDSNDSAYLIGKGTASLQLGETGHWRLDKNRIHTGWYQLSDSSSSTPLGSLHFDTGAEGGTTYYWDYGMHYPDKAGGGNNKFLYIRRSNDSTSTTLGTMKGRIDDDSWWTYKFYIDGDGNVHAPGFYIGDSATPIGGGAGTVAERLTQGYGSATQPVYFNSNGVPTNTTYTLNAAGAKGVVTDLANNTTSTDLPTAAAVASYVTSRGYITSYTDNKVQTSQANTSKIYLAGTITAGTSTGTLNFDSNVYLTTTAGVLHATTFEGNLSGTATKANQDGDGNVIKSTYLKLTGGNVTGAVTFGSSVSVDELTAGDLVVNGAASFTNNLQANTINGVAVGNSPKFTDTTYSSLSAASGGTAVSLVTTGEKYTWNNKQDKLTNPVTGTGTSGYLTKWTGTNTIGNGPALGTDGTKFLNNKGEWVVPAGTGVTSVAASGSGGITISGSPITTNGTITIGLNLSTAINGLGEGTSDANRNDYIVAQYANGGTTTTSYHRRNLAHIFAALNKSDITTALGYTPPTTDTNTHRPIQLDSTEILGNNTTALNLVTGGGMTLTNSSGAVTIAHKDTSSQNSSSNSGRTYIQSITLDTYGHVTALTTASETVTDTHYTTHLYAGKSDGNVNAATTNGNTYLMVLDNTTVRDRRKISGSGAAEVTSDSSGNITISSPIAITGVSFANGTITFTKSDGNTIPITTDNFVITQATGATALVRLKANSTTEYEGYSAGGATTAPVYFDSNGHPAAVTSIPWSLIANKPSSYTPSSHTHGNITNGGDITTTATIASGDRLVINDESESKINNSSITFGTSTTTFLTNKGTWATPVGTTYTFDGTYNASSNKAATVSTVTNAINALDGGTIGTPSASKTVTAISQTNGNISVTFGDISITKSQISDFPTSMAPTAHTHDDRYYTETEIDDRLKKYIPFSHYSNTNGSNSGKYYKISINSYIGWMLNFTVKLYHAYRAFDLQISGYNYGSSHWYSPAAVVLGASVTDTIEVNFGYDSDYHLWIAIPAQQYTGIGVTSFTNGYQQVDSWEDLFTITMVDGLPSTKQSTVTAYRPWYRNETVSNATSATSAGKWTTARNFTIKDSDSTNSGTAASVDGSGAVTLLLPSTIKASLTGNASTATKWASAQTVYVTLGTASTSTTIQGGSSSAQTIGVNGTLAIGNGGTGLTSSPSMLTNLGSTTAANVLQASPRPGITGTLGAANGGTGQTSLINAANSLLNALSTGSSTPVDNDYYISQYVGGGTTTTTYHRRPMSALWSYISGKISSSGTYVTIATDQTITANQKTFNGAIRWGTVSKYGAAHYDSTLEAIVFSFT